MRILGLLAAVALGFAGAPAGVQASPGSKLPTRRQVLKGLAGVPLVYPATVAGVFAGARDQTRIAFGSCLAQDQPLPIVRAIAAEHPDLVALLGDNIYADTRDMKEMASKYLQLATHPDFAPFVRDLPVKATWDDHDFGENDAGREYPMKHQSRKLFLDFLGEPADSPRRLRPDGVYEAYLVGSAPRRVQVILLDMRWNRSPLSWDEAGKRYRRDDSQEATFLGDRQWQWLERRLHEPAEVRLLGSSIQFASSEHPYEKWANFPREKRRLMNLIDRLGLKNTHILSGDIHAGELSTEVTPGGVELIDFSSSGLNHYEWVDWPNARRVALYDRGPNYGLVRVDWPARRLHLELKGETGATIFQREVPLR